MATEEVLGGWIAMRSAAVQKVAGPFGLVRGLLSNLKGKKTSVEIQHEATGLWAKRYS